MIELTDPLDFAALVPVVLEYVSIGIFSGLFIALVSSLFPFAFKQLLSIIKRA